MVRRGLAVLPNSPQIRSPIQILIPTLNTWKHGSKRAPHKPLLLLLALGAYKNNRSLHWKDVDDELGQLLRQFGGASSKGTHYPFIRLQNDGLWVVKGYEAVKGDARVTDLNADNPLAHLSPSLLQELNGNPAVLKTMVCQLLDEHFSESMHAEILDSTGIAFNEVQTVITKRRKRDPEFKNAVLNAYDRKCAVCGYGGRLNEISVGLEAAHIQWHAYGGPDTLINGIALCSLHHKLFDRGAFALDHEYKLIPSKRLNGPGADDVVFKYAGEQIRLPRNQVEAPAVEYLKWQRVEVLQD